MSAEDRVRESAVKIWQILKCRLSHKKICYVADIEDVGCYIGKYTM